LRVLQSGRSVSQEAWLIVLKAVPERVLPTTDSAVVVAHRAVPEDPIVLVYARNGKNTGGFGSSDRFLDGLSGSARSCWLSLDLSLRQLFPRRAAWREASEALGGYRL